MTLRQWPAGARGALADQMVKTVVAVDVQGHWPDAPPHWLHFLDSIRFAGTNTEPSSKPGWLR